MKAHKIDTVIYRADGNEFVADIIALMKKERIPCKVATATVWRRGLPRTEHVFSASEADAPRAKRLLRHLPIAIPEPAVSREKKLFIVSALVVIGIIALVRLVRLFTGA